MESSATASELCLDCKPQTYSMLLKSFGEHHQVHNHHHSHDHTQNLKQILSCLEEERLKIDAFKRELPLCMQLLTNAVETSRQQLQAYKSSSSSANENRPVLEEFIPIKQQYEENPDQKKTSSNNVSDKANWMTSAQLWCQTNNTEGSKKDHESDNNNTISFSIVSPKLGLDAKQRNGGAFLPFSKDRASRSVTDLALIGGGGSDEKDIMLMEDNKKSCFEGDNVNEVGKTQMVHNNSTTTTTDQGQVQNSNGGGGQTNRKARRCWSPDLHRRFVNALQMLGGSQMATPKQIRELMKVDGLTNDEVKSHLQKYRLHTRRPTCPGSTQQTVAAAAAAPHHQLVVLGGIWVPPEYYSSAVGAPHQLSHAPSHFCPPPNFYHNNNTNITTTTTNSSNSRLINYDGKIFHAYGSPEGDGDRSESMEDVKSESTSWKGESGENGGDGKSGLVAFKEDGDQESNGSDITLKF